MIKQTDDNIIRVVSDNYEEIIIPLDDVSAKEEEKETTKALIKGVVSGFIERNYAVGGFQSYITSDVSEILSDMTDYAVEKGMIPENTVAYRDLFDTKIMGVLTPAPSVVRAKFKELRSYTDKEAFIFSETDGVPHNTITPIARRNGEQYEMDLVLRNNITTAESIIQKEIADCFVQVLECAGVYKRTEEGMKAFKRFLSVL